MAGRERRLTVIIAGDAKGLQRAVGDADRATSGLGGRLADFGKKAAIGLAGVGIAGAAVAKSLIDSASTMEETLSKSNTIFGVQGAALEEWASTAASSFGQSKQEALEAAATFGNIFTQLGVGTPEAAGLSTAMTELASDFASFHNAAPTDVIDAMTAAFRGEYDAVQRFVPTINAAAVEQKALATTGKKTTKELTLQEKALATQALLLEGAGAAMGDFSRTSDGAANKQRILSAQWKDVQAQLGQHLLPIYTKLVGWIADKLPGALEGATRWVKDHKSVLIALAAVVGGILTAAFAAWAVSVIAATWPIIAIGAALAAVTAGVIYAYENWDWFRKAVDAVARFVTTKLWPALQTGAAWITGTLIPTIGRVAGTFANWARTAADIAISIKGHLDSVVGFVTGLPGRISNAARGMWDGIKNAFRSAVNWVIDAWNRLEFKIPGFDPPGPGPKFGGFTLGVPNIPRLAGGGIARARPGGILANIAEGGRDEVVAPLDLLPGLLGLDRNQGGSPPVHVHLMLDRRELGSAIIDFNRDYAAVNGRGAFAR